MDNLQAALSDSRYRLNTDKEDWLRERGELQRQLTESRNSHLMDQQKVTDLLAQVVYLIGFINIRAHTKTVNSLI